MRHGARLGIDVGDARIGVARSDPQVCSRLRWRRSGGWAPSGGCWTSPRTWTRWRSWSACLGHCLGPKDQLRRRFARSRSGSPGPTQLPVRLVDERLSTVSAEGVLREQGRKGQKRRQVVDQVAAVVILQNALETERSTGDPAGELVAPPDVERIEQD